MKKLTVKDRIEELKYEVHGAVTNAIIHGVSHDDAVIAVFDALGIEYDIQCEHQAA